MTKNAVYVCMYLQRMCVRVFLILFSWVAPINIALRIIIIINNYRFCSLYSRIRILAFASVFAFVFHLDDVCVPCANIWIIFSLYGCNNKNHFFQFWFPPSPVLTFTVILILILIPILILIYSWAELKPSICYEFLKLFVHPPLVDCEMFFL